MVAPAKRLRFRGTLVLMTERMLIITGATGGLGATVVRHLVADYHCVVLFHSQTGFDGLRAAAGGDPARLQGVQADLTSEQSVHDALTEIGRRFGTPYGLVHLAGGFASGRVSETSSETWERMLTLNVTGAFLMIRETLALMPRDRAGRIVAISSQSSLAADAKSAAYTISKAALNLLVTLTAKELKGTSITANVLAPGSLDTDATRAAMPDAHRIPLESIASTISFLLSDAAADISGAVIPLPA